ncbi:MAG: tetratricopeptide repeat protein [Burkholderiales bacterium]
MKHAEDHLKPARQLGIGLLLAGLGAGMAQASSHTEPDIDPAGPALRLRLAQIPADAQTPQQTAPRADSTKKKSSSSKRRKETGAQPNSGAEAAAPAAPSAARVREFMQLSGAQIEQRIAELRQVLRHFPKSEPTRQTLGLISVELANRILDLDALDRKDEIAHWTEVIRKDLHDTFWRTTQLAKSDDRAAAALGLFYSEGILTARAPEKGCEQYARAAQRGHVAAAYQAALCKARTDPALAKILLERAAEKDHAGAQELMGRACIEGEHKDNTCAFEWLERSAARGRPSAMSLLGWLYASDPERLDLVKSVNYYRAAAGAGDQAAQNNLGELYETGRGVAQDATQAFNWYARAAKAGFPQAQLNLARLYAAGSGVARDRASARRWAERAQEQGQTRAQELLDWLAAQH